jgi:hexosaminidase
VPHGGYYTATEIRQIVTHAAALGVTVVPEIDMPGHMQAAIAAYPWLGNTGLRLPVATGWGISEHVLNVTDRTLAFCREILDEVFGLFPGPHVHIGGDECPKAEWRASEQAQARITELGLRDEDALQSWFLSQVAEFVIASGRRPVGWDEILEGGLPDGTTVMSWRGEDGGITAARLGHDVVMTPATHTYFDHYQSSDRASEPLAIGGLLELPAVYGYEPVPKQLEPRHHHHVLGSQFQLWTEYMRTPDEVEYMAFPRACALADVLWSPRHDLDDFGRRLAGHLGRLRALGVSYRAAAGPGEA